MTHDELLDQIDKFGIDEAVSEQIAKEIEEKLLLLARYSNKDELNLIRYEEAVNIVRGE